MRYFNFRRFANKVARFCSTLFAQFADLVYKCFKPFPQETIEMTIKIGTFNVNNLFERVRLLNLDGFSAKAAAVLTDVQELSALLEKDSYTGETGAKIKAMLEKYNFHKPTRNPWFKINEVRDKLFGAKADGSGVTIKAKGRLDWVGWLELVRAETSEASTDNTARVLTAVNADIVCLVEVEDRLTLARFNDNVLSKFGAAYQHNLLIDGNDERGIDLAVLSRFPIQTVRPHIDDSFKSAGKTYKIFSRDCPEYEIILPDGKPLWLLCNHLKSKGYGNQTSNDNKRKRQANRVCDILERFDLTKDYVAVAGDFNDTPNREPLQKLLTLPNLHDVLKNSTAPDWTYQTGGERIDYLLVSKPLFDKIKNVGIERRGIYSKNDFGGAFPHFPEVTSRTAQASDHAAVWAEFDI